LRRPDPELHDLLADKLDGISYPTAPTFKLLAAIGTPEQIIDTLFRLMEDTPRETAYWNCSHWVPSLLRRMEQDPEVADKMIESVVTTSSASARISFLALVGRTSNGRTKYRSTFSQEAERISKEVAPSIGFDVTSGSESLAQHILRDLVL
jgi:hypothetical protein